MKATYVGTIFQIFQSVRTSSIFNTFYITLQNIAEYYRILQNIAEYCRRYLGPTVRRGVRLVVSSQSRLSASLPVVISTLRETQAASQPDRGVVVSSY